MKYYVILGITRYMVPVAIWYLPQMSAFFCAIFLVWHGVCAPIQSSFNLLLLLQDLDMRYKQNLDTNQKKKK